MSEAPFHTLLLEASPARRQALASLLGDRLGALTTRARASAASPWLERPRWDLVLISTGHPGLLGLWERLKERGLEIALLFAPRQAEGSPSSPLYLGLTSLSQLKLARRRLQVCGRWWEVQPAGSPDRERERKLLNRVHDGILELGPEDRIRWANAAMRRAAGIEALEGVPFEALVEEADAVCLQAVREQQRQGVIAPFMVRLREGRPVEVDPSPRFGPAGEYLGSSVLVRLDRPGTEAELQDSRSLVNLYQVASDLSRAFGLEEVLEAVLQSTLRLGLYGAVGVQPLEGEGSSWSARRLGEPLTPELEGTVVGFCSRLEPGHPLRVIKDPRKDPDPAAAELLRAGYAGLAAVHLGGGGRPAGILWALGRSSSGFTRERNSLLISIGAQAGVAVENARHMEASLEEAASRRRFYRDALQAVTQGKLVLCEYEELEEHWREMGEPRGGMPLRSFEDVPEARKRVEGLLVEGGFAQERIFNMVICVSEAATNVVKYGPVGALEVRSTPSAFRVRMDDEGPGIAFAQLPRAVLTSGFSTAPSLGLGYSVLLEMCDRLYLATGEQGTRLILEVCRESADPLDAFIGLAGGSEGWGT